MCTWTNLNQSAMAGTRILVTSEKVDFAPGPFKSLEFGKGGRSLPVRKGFKHSSGRR
jgi:hypothetical protein